MCSRHIYGRLAIVDFFNNSENNHFVSGTYIMDFALDKRLAKQRCVTLVASAF